MTKEKVLKIVKSKIFLGIVCFILGGSIMSDSGSVLELEESVKVLNQEVVEKNSKIEELEAKVEEAKPWFDMKEEERKAEEARIAEEKAKKEAEEKAKAEEEARLAEEKKKAEEEAKKQAEAQKYETGLTYEDLARNPSQHMLKYVKFEGKIIQVMKGDGYTQYRMAINDDYDKVVLIEISNDKLVSGNILEDDYIYIKGQFLMEQTYKTVLGAEMTIPAIVIDEFSF